MAKLITKSKKITLAIIILIFAGLIIFILTRERNLEKNGVILNAKTLEWITGAKMSMELRYEFIYKGEKIIDNNATGAYRGNDNFVGKYFPVMYDQKLGMSELLVTPEDFRKYNLPFPDSLKWVLPYLN